MPRPNQPRRLASERALARRIAHERERNEMSYEGLALRMEKVGCPINASAIYKIEKSDPPRRITVDELVGFSLVFGIEINNLLMPPELAAREDLVSLLTHWDEQRVEAGLAADRAKDAFDALKAYVGSNPETEDDLASLVETWAEYYYEPEDRASGSAMTMFRLTGSKKWATAFKQAHPDLYPEA